MNASPQTAPQWVSETEYLQYCEQFPENKFELIDGEIVAMAGASLNHRWCPEKCAGLNLFGMIDCPKSNIK